MSFITEILNFVKELGVEIGTVHNIISFKQKNWMNKYISFNTEKRKEAKKKRKSDCQI